MDKLSKKILTLAMLLCVAAFGYAQDYQKEINEQVWKPFIEGFNTQNSQMFLGVHSKDLIRSPRDSKALLNWDEYLKQQQRGDARTKADGAKINLELHFTERIANANQAIDVGIYQTTFTPKGGKSQSSYGRFHVVLRKENGVWKILVDTDSSEGETIGEKDFVAAKPM